MRQFDDRNAIRIRFDKRIDARSIHACRAPKAPDAKPRPFDDDRRGDERAEECARGRVDEAVRRDIRAAGSAHGAGVRCAHAASRPDCSDTDRSDAAHDMTHDITRAAQRDVARQRGGTRCTPRRSPRYLAARASRRPAASAAHGRRARPGRAA
ncbi:hypothetical protein [Burkholderia sp. MSMB617WGS]|uniref:hypothetical protein n=1 Tax=Burkholderia sp. MSMB617WGS TaxID=1637831 RepID=UPI001F300D5B|nr:hypothetical protein [Burkholderia sp. MSMB617WGS]